MKKTWILFESRPAIHTDGEAWCYGRSALYVRPDRVWRRVHSAETAMEGIVWSEQTGRVTRRKIGKWFGRLPALPRDAFT